MIRFSLIMKGLLFFKRKGREGKKNARNEKRTKGKKKRKTMRKAREKKEEAEKEQWTVVTSFRNLRVGCPPRLAFGTGDGGNGWVGFWELNFGVAWRSWLGAKF